MSTFLTTPGLALAALLLAAAPVRAIPIAEAGVDQTIFEGTSIQLSGSAIDDGDAVVSFFWSIDAAPAGSNAAFNNPFAPNPTFSPDLLGAYDLSFMVADSGGESSAPDTVTITVIDNLDPVAIAMADVLSGPVPLTVVFDATASFDPEGAPLFFDWSFGDGSLPSNDPLVTHVFNSSGLFVVSLAVVDDFGQGSGDTLTIEVGLDEPEPVPAPATFFLFAFGLGGLGVLGLRQRKQAR